MRSVFSAFQGYKRLKATPVRREEIKKKQSGKAEISYSLRFEHSEVSIYVPSLRGRFTELRICYEE